MQINPTVDTAIKAYIKEHISPKETEKCMVRKHYEIIQKILGENTFQSGSFARFTAVTPIHDLDIIWVLPDDVLSKSFAITEAIDPYKLKIKETMDILRTKIQQGYSSVGISVTVKVQSHSIGISFVDGFSIDVVPAIRSGKKNEYGDDIFSVPEVQKIAVNKRINNYSNVTSTKPIKWIKSDPKGYIRECIDLNLKNQNFRRVVKFLKFWKDKCKLQIPTLPLKSFHVECIVSEIVKTNPNADCLELIILFFQYLYTYLERPRINDKADSSTFVDSYILEIPVTTKEQLLNIAETHVISLENATESDNINDLLDNILSGRPYLNREVSEHFLYDDDIHMMLQPTISIRIDGVLETKNNSVGGFRNGTYLSMVNGIIGKNHRIYFDIVDEKLGSIDSQEISYKWKVKNKGVEACNASCLRGEITDHHTRYQPESTAYKGSHYVEVYAIKNNVCIAKDRIQVEIR
ncbi:hypothetical protein NO2_0364 [Candidatus Termititenax persephonae]|uniref:Adenylyl/Guanylyl and SMODS C-terminal sensor domain-containing protein n=1 Tax=Candidatus Termititenax persephonae TaxID=2218525 RepID=A0A388TFA9_9BACT|nr:hypothetical protein NO2_0364 [Candidatus Termititenax persephonae]